MRQFTATLDIPTQCDCCGAALGSLDAGISRGKFRLEFSEPAEFSLGQFAKVTIGGGKLHVALRQNRGSNRGWGLRPHYNTTCFGSRLRKDTVVEANKPNEVWYTFDFDLVADFHPSFATWWAELVFVEIVPFKQGFNGGPVESHSPASFRLKLETLD
jgi:hypothetical protein